MRTNNHICAILALVMFSSATLFAETDSIPLRHHRIQTNPLSLLMGGLYGNYEFRMSQHHAVAVEGEYVLPLLGTKAWAAGGGYRYYYHKYSFLGIFANKGDLSVEIPGQRGDNNTYTVELSYLTIGANWGRAWYLKNRFPFAIRIGAGFPAQSDLSWKDNNPHPEKKLMEGLYRFSACLDGALSIGISF